jgi:hypothetical protein
MLGCLLFGTVMESKILFNFEKFEIVASVFKG